MGIGGGLLLLNQNGWLCKFVFVMLQLVETGLLIGLSVALLLQVRRLHVQFALELERDSIRDCSCGLLLGNFEWTFEFSLFQFQFKLFYTSYF